MKITKTLIIILAFLITSFIVVAIPFIPSGNMEGMGLYHINNFTNINITGNIYQSGSPLMVSSAYSHLGNFTDDLGTRGYILLSNFTDDLGARGYTHLTNFSNDLGYSHLSNLTDDITVDANVNGSNYWDSFDTPRDFDNGILLHWNNISSKFITSIDNFDFILNVAQLKLNWSSINATITALGGADTRMDTSGIWLYNTSTAHYFNESKLQSEFINSTKAMSVFVNRSIWTTIDNYPSACTSGQYVSQIGDTLTCSVPTDTNASTVCSGTHTFLNGEGACEEIGNVSYFANDRAYMQFLKNDTAPFLAASLDSASFSLLNTTNISFANDLVNHRIYDNTTCVTIRGDTSELHIC